MDRPLVYLDRSDILPGKVSELTAAVMALVEFIERHEPQLLSYAFYIDSESSTMAVVAVHPDPASLELHLRIGGPEFRRVGEFIDLRQIDVFGEPGTAVQTLLEEKAAALGRSARITVHEGGIGFSRWPATTAGPPPGAGA